MTRAPLSSSVPPTPYRILLIDDDRVYRSGLRLWLEQTLGARVVAEAETAEAAWRSLDPRSETTPTHPIDLVLLSLSLAASDANDSSESAQADRIGFAPGFALCRQVRDRHPQLPILVLSPSDQPILAAAAQQAGATGFCAKTIDPSDLAILINQVMGLPTPELEQWENPDSPLQPIQPNRFTQLRRNLRRSSVQQIDQSLAPLLIQLRDPALSVWDRAVIAGRVRELRASRWLLHRLLATPLLAESGDPDLGRSSGDRPRRPNSGFFATTPPGIGSGDRPRPRTSAPRSEGARPINGAQINPIQPARGAAQTGIVPVAEVELSASTVNVPTLSLLFDEIASKLQGTLENLTDRPLETDILRVDQKRTLFLLILRKLEDLLNELRFSQVPASQFEERRSQLLLDLWEATIIDFFGRYTTIPLQGYEVEVAGSLLQDAGPIGTEILEKIPGFPTLLSHLLFQTPLLIEGVPYAAGNPEALMRAETLLSNLTIQLANAVVQPLLNRFADLEPIKQNFYDRRLMSSREIERFRNNLSWRYRVERYFEEPRDIFESQYRLLTFHERGIYAIAIYAPRRTELEQLSGIRYAVTLALETRDAIAPRLRSAISVVGSGIIYFLTEVLGRGIGLVGRGVLKGIGNTWQDGRRKE